MYEQDLFDDEMVTSAWGGPAVPSRTFNTSLMTALRSGPTSAHSDIDTAVVLAQFVHDELERFGTGRPTELNDHVLREALLALRAVVTRLGVAHPDVPFRDFAGFEIWWKRQGAAGNGGYQKRRDLLVGIFGDLHDQLAAVQSQALASTLAQPVSPAGATGWPAVDAELAEVRRHFLSASTPNDYAAVGNDCVRALEALSAIAYDPAVHLRPGEDLPPVDKTKARLERVAEDAANGRANAEIRKVARAAIELAQAVKHGGTPDRRSAGIAADAVILVVNIIRRLS